MKKNIAVDKDKCWTMAGNEGYFIIDFNTTVDLVFVRYEHYEFVDEDDAKRFPRKLMVYVSLESP